MSYVLVEAIVRDSEGAEIDKRPIAFVEVTTGITTDVGGGGTTLNGTGFVKATGTTITYDNSTYVPTNSAITGATKTKLTYDSKGLVTAGADATTEDIAASTNKNYVTDAQAVVIGNTSGTNTGDETITTIKSKLGVTTLSGNNTGDQDLSTLVPTARTVNGHALSANVTVSKSDVGLGNVDNTSDASKPVSTAQQTALDAKLTGNTAITGATKTKITYDSKGLVTAGADATAADIAASTNKNYVTDAQQTVIGNTSGTNSGDETTARINALYGYTPANAATVMANTAAIAAKDTKTMQLKVYQALGSTIIAEPATSSISTLTATNALTSQQVVFTAVYLNSDQVLTGVKFVQAATGSYTASNYNGVGLYTYSAGIMTLVASSTDDGNIWKGTANTFQSKAFSSTYSAVAGVYYVAIMYSSSAQTTAPSIKGSAAITASTTSGDFTNGAKLTGVLTAQTVLPSPQAMSGTSQSGTSFWTALY